MINRNSDLAFWIEWYTCNYTAGIFSLEYLKDKLNRLKLVEDMWKNHKDCKSFSNCVEALKIVIERINEE